MKRHRYEESERLLERALISIPLGSQTFSKSMVQYPRGCSPLFISRGDGSRVWDVDGNEYIDFVNGLLAVSLGYKDSDVDAAVRAQMEKGVIFSLPHPLELEVAERIIHCVPSAEMVRFGKNGSDVTAGAVRVCRAYTGREMVAVCGYHGWQDWYIGTTTRADGVPESTRSLTKSFCYNDIASLEQLFAEHPGQIGTVILEPLNVQPPKDNFLQKVKDLAHANGALLVFDEMITGFRWSIGGAQSYYGVTPDLTTLGKGLANGYPLAAIAGRADIMKWFEKIFFSFTFGGETLSLAAALAVINKLEREPVIDTLWARGEQLLTGLQGAIKGHGVEHFAGTAGTAIWSFFTLIDCGGYSRMQILSLFMQEMFARGILTFGTHNLSYAHTSDDIVKLLAAYDEVLPILKQAVDGKTLEQLLTCPPIEPLFKVR